MKIWHKIKDIPFPPIELTITIESKAELASLAARLNMGISALDESGASSAYPEHKKADLYTLWSTVNGLYKRAER